MITGHSQLPGDPAAVDGGSGGVSAPASSARGEPHPARHMWDGLAGAWGMVGQRAQSVAHAASDLAASASEQWESATGAESEVRSNGSRLSSLLEGAASAAANAATVVQNAGAGVAEGAGVLARQTKLKGEISLLESNVVAWKREWGAESCIA